MRCSMFLSKSILLIIFAFLWLVAGGLIFIGAYTFHIGGNIENVIKSTNIFYPAIILISVGIFLFLIGFMGCFACVLESKCMLTSFFIVFLVVFIGEVVATILCIVYKKQVNAKIEDALFKAIGKYGFNDSVLNKEIDYIQSKFQCCGVKSSADWLKTPYYNKNGTYPDSCCPSHHCESQEEINTWIMGEISTKMTTTPANNEPYSRGCLTEMKTYLSKFMTIEILVAAIVVALQILGLVATCIIIYKIRNQNSYDQLGPIQNDVYTHQYA